MAIVVGVPPLSHPVRAVCKLLEVRAHRSSTNRIAWLVELKTVVVNAHRLERLLTDEPEHDDGRLLFTSRQFSKVSLQYSSHLERKRDIKRSHLVGYVLNPIPW